MPTDRIDPSDLRREMDAAGLADIGQRNDFLEQESLRLRESLMTLQQAWQALEDAGDLLVERDWDRSVRLNLILTDRYYDGRTLAECVDQMIKSAT